jgi:hypothetical protein
MGRWVQLLSVKHIEVQGKLRPFQAGDWVEVGKQTALRWQSEGAARMPGAEMLETDVLTPGQSGILLTGHEATGRERLKEYKDLLEIETTDVPRLPWPCTLIWNPKVRIRLDLLPIGFLLLDTWQVAAPLCDYKLLASKVGSKEDRARTKAIVKDLRVPLYQPGQVYIRRCSDTQYFVEVWQQEWKKGGDERLALLRAIYRTKPLILALPITWCGQHIMGE